MIKKEEVWNIANLARLGLSEKEIKKFQKELSSILDYFRLLEKADTLKTEPTFHIEEKSSFLREDLAEPEDLKSADKLIEFAPNRKDRHIKVKTIFQ